MLFRSNVAWFGLLPATGADYVPSWIEVVVVLNLMSFGAMVFALAAKYLPLFEHYDPHPAAEPEGLAHVPA